MGSNVSFLGGKINTNYKSWINWEWQMKNSIQTKDALKKYINITTQEEKEIEQCLERLRMRITPYYLSLMNADDINDPIRKQAIPVKDELFGSKGETMDSLKEQEQSPVPGLVHRYSDRVLFLATNQCYMYCRHCTRRHFVSKCRNTDVDNQYEACFEYIRNNKDIRDVIISGGDPFTLPDTSIEYILKNLRMIAHVEIIRIGTRTPVVLPFRITDELCRIIAKYHPVWVNTHFNHPNEITPDSEKACDKLLSYGIPLNNQTVLLSGVNDSVDTMRELVHKLMQIRVRPYYLYQCDMVEGLGHFRTPVSTGINIIEYMRGWTSGMAVPTYVIDAPGGGGKIPLQPQYIVEQNKDEITFRNYKNQKIIYPLRKQ